MPIGITEEEENQIIDNFFFLVFMCNPAEQKVRVIIDGGVLKTTMKKDKFVKIMQRLCQQNLVMKIERALYEYGDWFLVDRNESTIRELYPSEEPEKLQIKKIHEDVLAEMEVKPDGYKDAAIQEYEETIMQKLASAAKKPLGVHVSRGGGYINYGLRKKTS